MEPPLPPLHPLLPQLLDHLQLRVVDALKWNVLACVESDDPGVVPTLILKFGSDERKAASIAYEVRIMREVIPALDASLFERLVLPEFVRAGEFMGVQWMLVRHIEGRPLLHDWSELSFKQEQFGGARIPPETAKIAVHVLRDLRLVDTAKLPKFVRRFNFSEWLETFAAEAPRLVELGLLDPMSHEAASRLFSSKQARRYEGSMFTNGDFYPRNFIFLPNDKIAVVDWVGGIDPWEFVAMHAWLLMWGNPKWQNVFAEELVRHFPVDVAEMQVGMLTRSFDLLLRWRDQPEEQVGKARNQMTWYFKNATDPDYVRSMFRA